MIAKSDSLNLEERIAFKERKVQVSEARDRMMTAIDTRIRDNAHRGAGHPSQEWKLLKSDLEVVRGVVETSSMSTSEEFAFHNLRIFPYDNDEQDEEERGTNA